MEGYQESAFTATPAAPTPWHALHRLGAQFVILHNDGKRPLKSGFRAKYPTPEQVIAELAKGRNIGLFPASIKLTAVDFDEPERYSREDLISILGKPTAWISSRRGGGGGHLYYQAPRMPDGRQAHVGSWKWSAGELRGDTLHIVLWGKEEAASILLNALNSPERLTTAKLDLTQLPGIKTEHHVLQPRNPDAPSGTSSTTKRSSGRRPGASDDEPLPFPADHEALRFALGIEHVRKCFEEDPSIPKGVDHTPSVYSASISDTSPGTRGTLTTRRSCASSQPIARCGRRAVRAHKGRG